MSGLRTEEVPLEATCVDCEGTYSNHEPSCARRTPSEAEAIRRATIAAHNPEAAAAERRGWEDERCANEDGPTPIDIIRGRAIIEVALYWRERVRLGLTTAGALEALEQVIDATPKEPRLVPAVPSPTDEERARHVLHALGDEWRDGPHVEWLAKEFREARESRRDSSLADHLRAIIKDLRTIDDASHWDECDARNCEDDYCECPREGDVVMHDETLCSCSLRYIRSACDHAQDALASLTSSANTETKR